MKWKKTPLICLVMCCFISAAVFLGCGGQKLASFWRDCEVTVDGQDDEWEGAMAYLSDENLAIGLMNDAEYIYLCLATVDSRVVRQVVGSGLTVWFDPKGGKKKTFGINFPMGVALAPDGNDMENKPQPGFGEGGPDPKRLGALLEASASEMAILGTGEKERRLMPVAGSQEVKVKLGYAGGKLVYEMRVPLVRDLEHPDAIGLEDDGSIGLGFETAEIDREAMGGRMRFGGPPTGGMDGGGPPRDDGMSGGGRQGGEVPGGRGPGRGGPGGQGPGGESSERLQLWTEIRLASAEKAASW